MKAWCVEVIDHGSDPEVAQTTCCVYSYIPFNMFW